MKERGLTGLRDFEKADEAIRRRRDKRAVRGLLFAFVEREVYGEFGPSRNRHRVVNGGRVKTCERLRACEA